MKQYAVLILVLSGFDAGSMTMGMDGRDACGSGGMYSTGSVRLPNITPILTFPHRGGRDSQFLDVNVGVVRLKCIVQRPCGCQISPPS